MINDAENCFFCSSPFYAEDFHNRPVCKDCLGKRFVKCVLCRNYLEREEAFEVVLADGKFLVCSDCSNCCSQCFECGDLVHNELLTFILHYGRDVCQDCLEEEYFECQICRDIILNASHERNGICQDCYIYDEDSDSDTLLDSGMIKLASADVLNFLQADDGDLLFGCELEVCTSGSVYDNACWVLENYGNDVILKQDSSITSYFESAKYDGFEIVTRPLTYLNQLNLWENFGIRRPKDLLGYKTGSCGCHIHVNRKVFDTDTLVKLIMFYNSSSNRLLIKKVAQRYDNMFSRKKSKSFLDNFVRNFETNNYSTTNFLFAGFGKYEFVNVSHANTIEIRLFRSTTNPNRLRSYFEFVKSSIEFCRSEVKLDNLTTENYKAYLQDIGKYPVVLDVINDICIKNKDYEKTGDNYLYV